MFPFRPKKIARPPGAGLTYCTGFDLLLTAEIPTAIVIEIEQLRSGGTDLDPPRKLARHQLEVPSGEITLRISTDHGVLGHPCAETFNFTVWSEAGDSAELEITETQASRAARVTRGRGWVAEYPEFAGPNGLRIEYRPLHGYLD